MCTTADSVGPAQPDTWFEAGQPVQQETRQRANPETFGPRFRGAELLMRMDAPVTVVPRKRRGAELALIIFVLGLTLGAYAIVDLNVTGEVSPTFPYLAGICTLMAALAYIAVRWRLPYADPVILPCVILLNGLGFAVGYTVVVPRPRLWSAVTWALVLELFTILLYPNWLGVTAVQELFSMSMIGHLGYGVTLGVMATRDLAVSS